jgi:hypothetical protein
MKQANIRIREKKAIIINKKKKRIFQKMKMAHQLFG